MAGLMGGLISLSISSIILVNVFIATVKGANTSAWTTGERRALEDSSALSSPVGYSDSRSNCGFRLRNNERLRSFIDADERQKRRGES